MTSELESNGIDAAVLDYVVEKYNPEKLKSKITDSRRKRPDISDTLREELPLQIQNILDILRYYAYN